MYSLPRNKWEKHVDVQRFISSVIGPLESRINCGHFDSGFAAKDPRCTPIVAQAQRTARKPSKNQRPLPLMGEWPTG